MESMSAQLAAAVPAVPAVPGAPPADAGTAEEREVEELRARISALEVENQELRNSLDSPPSLVENVSRPPINISDILGHEPLPRRRNIPIHVLLVEDEAFQQEVLKALFARW